MNELAIVIRAMEQSVCHGYSTDGIIRKTVLVREQREVIIIRWVELPTAANDVTNNCAYYRVKVLILQCTIIQFRCKGRIG